MPSKTKVCVSEFLPLEPTSHSSRELKSSVPNTSGSGCHAPQIPCQPSAPPSSDCWIRLGFEVPRPLSTSGGRLWTPSASLAVIFPRPDVPAHCH